MKTFVRIVNSSGISFGLVCEDLEKQIQKIIDENIKTKNIKIKSYCHETRQETERRTQMHFLSAIIITSDATRSHNELDIGTVI